MNYKIQLTFIVSVKKIQQIDYGEGNDLFLFPVHEHHHFKIETFEVVWTCNPTTKTNERFDEYLSFLIKYLKRHYDAYKIELKEKILIK